MFLPCPATTPTFAFSCDRGSRWPDSYRDELGPDTEVLDFCLTRLLAGVYWPMDVDVHGLRVLLVSSVFVWCNEALVTLDPGTDMRDE